MGSNKSKSETTYLSPYLQRKAQMPELQQVFGPWRQRSTDRATLTHFYRDFRKEQGYGYKSAPRFWQLPPHLRREAQLYEDELCLRWAERIRHTPDFRRILHMIAINQFKNPGQTRQAWREGMIQIRRNERRMRELLSYLEGEPQAQEPVKRGVFRLPL